MAKLTNGLGDNQGEPNNVNIKEVLLEIIKDRAQQNPFEDEDSQHSEETGDPVRKKKRVPDRSRFSKGKAKVSFYSAKFRPF